LKCGPEHLEQNFFFYRLDLDRFYRTGEIFGFLVENPRGRASQAPGTIVLK
jgi:hypothetical protein